EERQRARGSRDADYVSALEDPASGSAELAALVEALRVGETRFFRHPAQLEALARGPLLELGKRLGGRKKIRAWSAGCASGEEPLTIAMLIAATMSPEEGWDVEVLATDI